MTTRRRKIQQVAVDSETGKILAICEEGRLWVSFGFSRMSYSADPDWRQLNFPEIEVSEVISNSATAIVPEIPRREKVMKDNSTIACEWYEKEDLTIDTSCGIIGFDAKPEELYSHCPFCCGPIVFNTDEDDFLLEDF